MSDAFSHIKTIHDLASGIDGKLILSGFGESLAPINEHFQIGDYEAMAQRAEQLHKQTGRNIYTPLVVMRPDLPANAKGGEEDVVALLGFVVDFDAGRGKDWKKRLPDGIDAQYVLETSPDNAQCFIFFENPILINSEADQHNAKHLLQKLTLSCNGADHAGAELSHVWRIPGLNNWPNKKKVKEGRDPNPYTVKITKQWDGSFMALSDIQGLPEQQKNLDKRCKKATERKPIGHPDLMANDIDTLISALQAIPNDLEYPEWIRLIAAYKAAVGGNDTYYPFVEEWSLQWPDNTPEIVRQKWDSITHAQAGARTIFFEAKKRGWTDAVPEWVEEFNRDHFVSTEGKESYVFVECYDPSFKRRTLNRLSFTGFRNLYSNEKIKKIVNGNMKFISKAKAWLDHPKRRTYLKGLTFFPGNDTPEGHYNLWGGFGIDPKAGSWEQMRTHILDVLCGGDVELFKYTIGWLANMVQNPDRQGEVAFVISGGKGVGKGTFGHYVGKFFGQHFLHVTNQKHLTGNFNNHLRDAVFVVLDEAFFAGDKKHESILKSIITEPILMIEKKGIDAVQSPNYTHIMMFSNETWVVPASVDERRFFVLHVSSENKPDKAHFEALYDEMNNGGPAAMLDYLLNYDLSDFDLRLIPQTNALIEQKLQSLNAQEKWLYSCLYDGYIGGKQWDNDRFLLRTQTAYNDYIQHHKDHSFEGKPLIDANWSRIIRNILIKNNQPLIIDGGKPTDDNGYRLPHTSFPPLTEAREAFERYIGGKVEWPLNDPEINLNELLK